MNISRTMAALMFCAVSLGASAQAESTLNNMKELQSQGFGARNAAAQAEGKEAAAAAATEQAEGDTDPSFPGGDVFLQAYLKKKLMHTGVNGKGTVEVSFHVDKKGNIYGAEVTKSAGSGLDTAAFNIVTGMPRWKPGLTNGEPADKPAKVAVTFGAED